MGNCKHYETCGLPGDPDPLFEGLCILHATISTKDRQAFTKALTVHRQEKGDTFRRIVFPEEIDFSGVSFSSMADFTFGIFMGMANFREATFSEGVTFYGATFHGIAIFIDTTFNREVIFSGVEFTKRALFTRSTFSHGAKFSEATFSQGADFPEAQFSGGEVSFRYSRLYGRTLFASRTESHPIFSKAHTVDCRQVIIEPLEALIFRNADLSKCRFLDTDLRKVQVTAVQWPQISHRSGVYDDPRISKWEESEGFPWERVERLYRQLKQNYEEQRDHGRAGDFHHGEKEMRRRNLETPLGVRVLLWLYWAAKWLWGAHPPTTVVAPRTCCGINCSIPGVGPCPKRQHHATYLERLA